MIVLSLVMMGGLVYLYNPREIVDRLDRVDWFLAGPIVCALAAMHLLQVELWRLMSSALNGSHLPRGVAVRAYFVGQAFGGVTPGNIGGDFYRAVAVKTGSTSWREAAGPVLGQRIVSYATIIFLAALAGSLLLAAKTGLLLLAIAGILLAVTALWTQRDGVVRLAHRVTSRLGRSHTRLLARAATAYRLAAALGFAFHLGCVCLMYALLISMGETPPLPATIGLLLVARAVSLLPLTPYGLGLQEGSLLLLLPSLGISPEAALAASLLSRLGMIIVAIVGVACFLWDRIGTRTEIEPARIEPQPAD